MAVLPCSTDLGCMTPTDELTGFVREALTRGIPRDDVSAALHSAGWNPEQVQAALDAFAPIAFPIAVPRPRAAVNARDAFLYLILFGTLWTIAFQVGRLAFVGIDRLFPPTGTRPPLGEAVRFSIAALIVATPVHLLVSRITARATAHDITRRISPVRRWLTYATMLGAAVVVLGDVTALVYGLLGGELTTPITLKLITVLTIAGGGLGFYVNALRQAEDAVTRSARPPLFA
jgi:hypothetical protein